MWYKIKKIYLWTQLVWPKQNLNMVPGIYHDATQWLISIVARVDSWWNPDPDWTITMADKDLWATTVYNRWDTVSAANAWNFFQRWNNYAFPYTWAATIVTSQTNASAYWPNNYYSSSTFRNVQGAHRDSSLNQDLWWNTTNTKVARRWPCPEGFHVPTISEWFTVLDVWSATLWAWNTRPSCWTNLITYLKLPIVYLHNWATPYTFNWWFVCSSFWNYQSMQDWDQLMITSSWTANVMNMQTVWACLRPFKNVPVTPNNSWTKLYPTT